MPKFTVIKKLVLQFEVEALDAQEAYDKCIEADDTTFIVDDCQYVVEDEDGEEQEYEE